MRIHIDSTQKVVEFVINVLICSGLCRILFILCSKDFNRFVIDTFSSKVMCSQPTEIYVST